MMNPNKSLYLTEHIRRSERMALDELKMGEETLMVRAGTAAFRAFKTLYPDVQTIAVFCGGGNNAGDGYVFARLAFQHGYAVIVYQYNPVEDLPLAAKAAALGAIAAGVYCRGLDDAIDSDVDFIVDALLGIGLQGNVREEIAHAINLINDSGLPVLALDVPSGLDADTGVVRGVCVKADVTVTFIALKLGLFSLDGPDHCGKILCDDLHLSASLAKTKPAVYQLDEHLMQGVISPRQKNSHKGMYGHVLIIGGGPGMPGAAYLSALAALRIGAGMVTVATLPEHAGHVLPLLPEAMIHGVEGVDDLLPLLVKATIVVIGPGLGESKWASALFKAAISAQLPLVIDASALNLLAKNPQHDDNWVLTPHPGEASRLLGCSTLDVQSDRCKSVEDIQQQYGGCVVLKGVGSLVSTGENHLYLCAAGNPGMASAGMGDVLSGMIGGLLAQGVALREATKLGVFLHAKAADEAVMTAGERGLLASDLVPYLRRQINKCT